MLVSLLVSIIVVLAEAVVSLVAPLVMVFVDVATREMRGAVSPEENTKPRLLCSCYCSLALALQRDQHGPCITCYEHPSHYATPSNFLVLLSAFQATGAVSKAPQNLPARELMLLYLY